jgi:hypothetical protein
VALTVRFAVAVAAVARGARAATSAVVTVIAASVRTERIFLIASSTPKSVNEWGANELELTLSKN